MGRLPAETRWGVRPRADPCPQLSPVLTLYPTREEQSQQRPDHIPRAWGPGARGRGRSPAPDVSPQSSLTGPADHIVAPLVASGHCVPPTPMLGEGPSGQGQSACGRMGCEHAVWPFAAVDKPAARETRGRQHDNVQRRKMKLREASVQLKRIESPTQRTRKGIRVPG